MKKRWYDYLWIASLTYLILGFFNILFAWLGLLCFFIPLLISIFGDSKAYCNRYCGRGQLFSLVGGRASASAQATRDAVARGAADAAADVVRRVAGRLGASGGGRKP